MPRLSGSLSNKACIVKIQKENSDLASSSSGTVLDKNAGLVLTHASIFQSLLTSKSKLLQQIETSGYCIDDPFPETCVTVTLELPKAGDSNTKQMEINQSTNYSSWFIDLRKTANSLMGNDEVPMQHYDIKGEIMCVWKCEELQRTLIDLLPSSEGWKFSEDPPALDDASKTSDRPKSEANASNDSNFDIYKTSLLLPCFAIIKLEGSPRHMTVDFTEFFVPQMLFKGQELFVIGTPFGEMSPSVFMNSMSKGVVANSSGPSDCLILTDARCIPGTEGGPLFFGSPCHNDYSLGGIIICPLCWKNNEWIGLSLACSLHEVIVSLATVISSVKDINLSLTSSSVPDMSVSLHENPSLAKAMQCVVLISAKHCWGSGIYIDPQQGYVVTCSHVVKAIAVNSKVSIYVPHFGWSEGSLLFKTAPGEVYDIALLHICVHKKHSNIQRLRCQSNIAQGIDVYSIGYALFSRTSMAPTVTRGILSKYSQARGQHIMIQSTCVVNGGASGGPLVTSDGQLLAMMACNARDSSSGASYPHINMGVPISIINTCLEKYKQTKDLEALEEWRNKNSGVRDMWKLQMTGIGLKSELKSLL